MNKDESGMVTAFVVVMAMAFLLMAGLVYDGGLAVSAKTQAINEAEAAARAGAQALDVQAYRAGGAATLDQGEARRLAKSYIDATGDTGEVTVDGDVVNVTIDREQSTAILNVIGVQKLWVTGDGSATAIQGLEGVQ